MAQTSAVPVVRMPSSESDPDSAFWQQVDAIVLEQGRLALRGRHALDFKQFENIAKRVCGQLTSSSGEHDSIGGRPVFRPTRYASQSKLLAHNENTFLAVWPRRILFGCHRPADTGGETLLVDNDKLTKRLDPSIIRRFRTKQIRYDRDYAVDFLHRSWQQIFGTSTKEGVEAYCKTVGLTHEWTDNALRTSSTQPALLTQPELGREVFVAQPLHWHPRALDPAVHDELLRLCGGAKHLPRQCLFGDGSIIDDSIVDEILSACTELEDSYAWRSADVLIIDNTRNAHARQPFTGERDMFVAMGPQTGFQSLSRQQPLPPDALMQRARAQLHAAATHRKTLQEDTAGSADASPDRQLPT